MFEFSIPRLRSKPFFEFSRLKSKIVKQMFEFLKAQHQNRLEVI